MRARVHCRPEDTGGRRRRTALAGVCARAVTWQLDALGGRCVVVMCCAGCRMHVTATPHIFA